MRDYVFAKEISCPSVRLIVKAIKKTANSAKSRLLQIDVCTICLMSIAIAWMHK